MLLPLVTQEQWLAMTVYMEAEGEPFDGKLAVAQVIRNRAKARNLSLADVVLQPMQFSCWNTDAPTRRKLDNPHPAFWDECCRAALYVGPDATQGATHYLNERVVLRESGHLPSWFDPAKVTYRIGNHTFLRI